MAYGRNITAQKGARTDYTYAQRSASDYLNPTQQIAYGNALAEAAKPMDTKNKDFKTQRKQIEDREYTMEQVNRLRDIAGINALGEYDIVRQDFSKPYKLNTSQGFLTDEKVGAESGALEKDTRRLGTVEDQRANTTMGFRDVQKGNTWMERYEALRKPRTLSDKAWNYGGSAGNAAASGDERVMLRERFKQMRLGVDLPRVSVNTSGNKMKGYDVRFNEDPTGMIFDKGFKQTAMNIAMRGKNSQGALKNLRHTSHGSLILGGLGGDFISPLINAANAPKYGANVWGGSAAGHSGPNDPFAGKYGQLNQQLMLNPEDIYAGTWGYTGAASDQPPVQGKNGLLNAMGV